MLEHHHPARALPQLDDPADVVVVGGGNAAICAALSARDYVKRVVIVEASDRAMRGGNTRHTRNIRHVHADSDAVMPGSYSEEEMWEDLLMVSSGEVNEYLARMVIRQSAFCPEFMESAGVLWQQPLRGSLQLSRTNRFFLGGGKAMLNAYYRTAEARGITVHYESPVVDISVVDDQVVGVIVEAQGERFRLAGRAVVFASGGYEANREWLAKHWGEASKGFAIRGTPHNTGLPLRSLLDSGAVAIGAPTGAHAICVDARGPMVDGGIVTRIDAIPFSIVVNLRGERFADEGKDLWPRRYASWGHLVAAQPQQLAFSIYDSKVADSFIPGLKRPHSARTIEELADLIGVPESPLVSTLDDYNRAVPPDRNADRSKLDGSATVGLEIPKSNWALRVDSPPFFAYPIRPGITFTYMGVTVDDSARIKTPDGVLSNAFAAGEIMSGNVLTEGYLAGFGLTIGTVFGRLAGSSAGRLVATA